MEFIPVWLFLKFRTLCCTSCSLYAFYMETDTKDKGTVKNTLKAAKCYAKVAAVADNQREAAFKSLNVGMFC